MYSNVHVLFTSVKTAHIHSTHKVLKGGGASVLASRGSALREDADLAPQVLDVSQQPLHLSTASRERLGGGGGEGGRRRDEVEGREREGMEEKERSRKGQERVWKIKKGRREEKERSRKGQERVCRGGEGGGGGSGGRGGKQY